MNRAVLTRRWAVCGLAAVAALVGSGAGPEEGGVDASTPAISEAGRRQFRDRLEAWIDETSQFQDRARAAIAKIDAGEPVGTILEDFPRLSRLLGGEPPFGGPRGGEGPDDDRGPGERGPMGLRRGPELSDEDVKAVRSFIETNVPRLAERLARAEKIAAEEKLPAGIADRMLRRLAPRLMMLREQHREDPALAAAQLDEFVAGLDVLEAARSYRQAEDKAPARETVRAALESHLAARLLVREMEIERAEAKLAEGRAELEALRAGKDDLISEKLGEIERGVWSPPIGERDRGRGKP